MKRVLLILACIYLGSFLVCQILLSNRSPADEVEFEAARAEDWYEERELR